MKPNKKAVLTYWECTILHTKNVTSFFLSKPCHIDKLRLVKYADEFLTTLQSGLSKTSQKVVKYVSHNALLNSE